MPYSFARYTGLALLVSLGIVCMNAPASSESSVSIHTVHSKPEMRSEKPLLFVDTGISVRRSESVVDLLLKDIRLGKKPLLFVDTGISVRRSESVVDLLLKNIRLGNTRSANDGLCNYCGNYLAGNMTADRTETFYAPLSGYALDANSPSKRSLAGVAIY
jgi:hypothetical protein